jgi:hypothetical protein
MKVTNRYDICWWNATSISKGQRIASRVITAIPGTILILMSNDNQLKSFAISTIILYRKNDTYHLSIYNLVTVGQQLLIYTKRCRNYSFGAVSTLVLRILRHGA